jgi:hypothetical protein
VTVPTPLSIESDVEPDTTQARVDELPAATCEGDAVNDAITGAEVDVPQLQADRVNATRPAIQSRRRGNFGERCMLRTASLGLI